MENPQSLTIKQFVDHVLKEYFPNYNTHILPKDILLFIFKNLCNLTEQYSRYGESWNIILSFDENKYKIYREYCNTYGQLLKYVPYVNDKIHGNVICWYNEYHYRRTFQHYHTKISYKYGKKNGIEKSWHVNGQLAYVCPYRNNEKHGTEKYWNANGKLYYKISYVNGKKHGTYMEWYENGQLWKEIPYVCTTNTIFDGVCTTNTIKDGVHEKKHGTEKRWYENGQLMSETPYVNGEKYGIEKHWCSNGQLCYAFFNIYGKQLNVRYLINFFS